MAFSTAANNLLDTATVKKVRVGSAIVSGNSASRNNSTLVKQTVVVNEAKLHKVYFSTETLLRITLPYTSSEQRLTYLAADRVEFFSENSADTVLTEIAK